MTALKTLKPNFKTNIRQHMINYLCLLLHKNFPTLLKSFDRFSPQRHRLLDDAIKNLIPLNTREHESNPQDTTRTPIRLAQHSVPIQAQWLAMVKKYINGRTW